MPCFSCSCFRDGKDRNGEKLDGGRGYCEHWDEEYWRGHECYRFSPGWYYPSKKVNTPKDLPKRYVPARKEPGSYIEYENVEEKSTRMKKSIKPEKLFYNHITKSVDVNQSGGKKQRMRYGMLFWMCLSAVYAIFFAVLSQAVPEVIAFTFIFFVFAVMFLLLGFSSKSNKYMFGKEKGLKKGSFVGICIGLSVVILVIIVG